MEYFLTMLVGSQTRSMNEKPRGHYVNFFISNPSDFPFFTPFSDRHFEKSDLLLYLSV